MPVNPQLEDGHTRLANEIVDALCKINLSAYETRVLMAVIRKTYGWHRKEDTISYSQFTELTGLQQGHLYRTVKGLISRQFILCRRNGHGVVYEFNKHYDMWDTPIQDNPVEDTPKEDTPIQDNPQKDSKDTPKEDTTLRTKGYPVEDNTKDILKIIKDNNVATTVAPNNIEEIVKSVKQSKNDPPEFIQYRRQIFAGLKTRRGYNSPIPGQEIKAINEMLREKYVPDTILKVWDKLKSDSFWQDKELPLTIVRKQIGAILASEKQVKQTSTVRYANG